jgi:hypothetical protein
MLSLAALKKTDEKVCPLMPALPQSVSQVAKGFWLFSKKNCFTCCAVGFAETRNG